MVKKRYLSSGLAVLLELGLGNSQAQDLPSALTPAESAAPSAAPRSVLEQNEYQQYIQNLQMVPLTISEKPKKEKCNEKDLQDMHDKSLEDIDQKRYLHTIIHPDHLRWLMLDAVVEADIHFAFCFYKPKSPNFKRKMLEAAQHYERRDFQRHRDAARIYFYLGDVEKARELFYQGSDDEEIIKVTPLSELSALRDRALSEGRDTLAGKIEWLLGNEKKTRRVITGWRWFPNTLRQVRDLIQESNYKAAILRLGGGAKIPFYREIIQKECKDHPKCLEMLQDYRIGGDIDLIKY